MEDDTDHGMSIAEISAGEQAGAMLRGMVKTNDPDQATVSKKLSIP